LQKGYAKRSFTFTLKFPHVCYKLVRQVMITIGTLLQRRPRFPDACSDESVSTLFEMHREPNFAEGYSRLSISVLVNVNIR